MKAILPSDTIFATVIQRGIVKTTLCLNGLSSESDIIRRVRSAMGNLLGLTTIELRNGSQGWSQQRTVMLTRSIAVS